MTMRSGLRLCVVDEVRDISSAPVVDLAARTIGGLAVPYGVLSQVLSVPGVGRFRERIESGAFGASLSGSEVFADWQHDQRGLLPLGRSGSNLELRSTARGVEYSLVLPHTSLADDLLELMSPWVDGRGVARAPIIPGRMSFGFRDPVDSWKGGVGEVRERSVRTATLRSISFVRDPAYLQTEAFLRPDAAGKWAERRNSLRHSSNTKGS